ncbi:uncharacterized protein LOC111023906 isoform X2 [Momordica charantia]|uniref:Uncharacterized protein LOC111023906 isoform X2 n=1 Tax=Momordica charantia TaxID=3673 RepID=A0A6J1DTP1_MOMCH|nr:uncharacterized protein LOC111023906 isoform X2 [Momordica charantia]XP_022157108.1 uncharacterized protein LOC111023906 isoform X2 [Momordica charantia]
MDEFSQKPICKNATRMSNAIRSIVRENFDPALYSRWLDVPMEVRDAAKQRIVNLFKVNMSQAIIRKYVHTALRTTFKEFRAELHAHYKENGPPNVAREKPHARITKLQDWHKLCDRWETPDWKEKSGKAKRSRAKLPYNHRAGSKSFGRLQHELKERRGVEIGPIEMFKETRHPDKGWVSGGESTYVRVKSSYSLWEYMILK